MTHRTSLLSGAATTLGLSLLLAACASVASPSPASPSGGVAGASAGGASSSATPASSGASPSASLTGQDTAEAAACDAIEAWSDSMKALRDLDPSTSSIEDIEAQREAIGVAWTDVKLRLQDVDAADEDAVVEAAKSLESTLDEGLQTDIPVADAIDEVQTAGEPLRAVYRDMADGLGCELVDPY
jgi:hypothetical protein